MSATVGLWWTSRRSSPKERKSISCRSILATGSTWPTELRFTGHWRLLRRTSKRAISWMRRRYEGTARIVTRRRVRFTAPPRSAWHPEDLVASLDLAATLLLQNRLHDAQIEALTAQKLFLGLENREDYFPRGPRNGLQLGRGHRRDDGAFAGVPACRETG